MSLLCFTPSQREHLFSWQSPFGLETTSLWEARASGAGSSQPPAAPSVKTFLYCFLFWTPPHTLPPEDLSFALLQLLFAPGWLPHELLPPPGCGVGALCKEHMGGCAGVGDPGPFTVQERLSLGKPTRAGR